MSAYPFSVTPLSEGLDEGQSHTMPKRPMPVSGEQVVNITPGVEAYGRLLAEASSTGRLYPDAIQVPTGAASYEIDTRVMTMRAQTDRLDPGEAVWFYSSHDDVNGAKQVYDDHANDPNSRVLSHCAYLNRRPGEKIEAAIARHELCINVIGTVKSPGSLHEPAQHSTANAAGTIARTHTHQKPGVAGQFFFWALPHPEEISQQYGQASHSKGTRPVLVDEPCEDPKLYDLRYWPMIVVVSKGLATLVRAEVVAGVPGPHELSLQKIAEHPDFKGAGVPKPRYIKAAYDQFLRVAQMAHIADHAANAADILVTLLDIAGTPTDPKHNGLRERWQQLQLASREGTMHHDKLLGGLYLTNPLPDKDMIFLPLRH